MSSPVAVLISDVHYNIRTLEVADKAMRMAIETANELDVPLIVAGDLHDTKANLRGECVNAMIETFKQCEFLPAVLVGNHDKINEKSKEHSLNFLSEHVNFIIDSPMELDFKLKTRSYFIPYQYDLNEFKKHLRVIPKDSTVIIHQGCSDASAGHYIQDKSALPKSVFADYRVISGHYHERQDIQCGPKKANNVGKFSFLGNPYTLGFGEASHRPKGYHVLMSDGALEFKPTNLRKHLVFNMRISDIEKHTAYFGMHTSPEDLIWIKISAASDKLALLKKEELARIFDIDGPFKLDLISTSKVAKNRQSTVKTAHEALDGIIDRSTDDLRRRSRLKELCQDLLTEVE